MAIGTDTDAGMEMLGEAPFRQLADHLPALCFIADRAGRVVWCNRRWHDYTGVPLDADPELAWPGVHDPQLLPGVLKRWSEALRTGEAGEAVVAIRGTDGRYRPFLTRAEPVRDQDGGAIACWLGTMTEISEQHEAERHQRFLVGLNDALRDATDPDSVQGAVRDMLRAHLEADHVDLAKVADIGAFADVEGWAELCAARTWVKQDTQEGRSFIRVPLMRQGTIDAIFELGCDTPRAWRDADVRLVEDVAERSWTALERAAAENARRESEARQRAIVDATPECVKIVSLAGELLYMNSAGLRMIDAAPGQAADLDVISLVAPDHRAAWIRNHGRVCAGEALAWEFDVIGLQGTRRRMETHAVPLAAADGSLQQLAVTRDVTERREAEERLRESEALLAAFMEHAPVGMYLKDADGRYLMVNPEMSKVFGRPAAQVVGRTATDLFGAGEATMIAAHDRRILDTLEPHSVEEFLPQLEAYGWSLVVRFPVATPGEQPRIGGFDIDISEHKRAEAELARSREMLYQSEKLTALGSLLAGVSHELNNPLSVVLTLSQVLAAKAEGTPFAERATKIHRAATRCARIVQSFLAMARQKAPERARLDANDLARSALELTGYGLRMAGIDIVQHLDPGLPPLDCDGDQLSQVLLNLLVNAQHALEGSDGPRVLTIATSADAHRRVVTISIADNGPGVPAEIRHRIFEPYFTSKPQGVGTGIGLAFSLGIVEAHGGTLRLEDEPGGGARFVIELPAAVGVAAAEPVRTRHPHPPAAACALVIDDDAEVGDALAELLEQQGYHVKMARSGRQAQALLRRHSYDAVLSDVRMPDLDGRGLFAWLERERPECLPRLGFVTGDTLGSTASHFLAHAGRPVLEKPFDADSLRGFLSLLGSRQAEPAS